MTDDLPTNGQRLGRKHTNMEMVSRIILAIATFRYCGSIMELFWNSWTISEYISMILQKDTKGGWYLRNANNCLSICYSRIFGIANPERTKFFNSIGQGVAWKVPKIFCFRWCKLSSWVKQTLNSPARRSRPCCWQPTDSAATILQSNHYKGLGRSVR